MDVVLRTPTGEAELSVGPGQEDVTIADLIERVTGRAPSEVVFVDGRAVPSSATLGTSGVLTGSVIATVDDAIVPPSDGRVELVQVAGEGTGARAWLRPGRYRIGVGRRISARELELAPVDRPMLDLEVDEDGAVTVRSTSLPARLDGRALSTDTSTPWTTGLVDVGGRVFALGRRDPRHATQVGHRYAGVGIDGKAAFNRPPRLAPAPESPPLDVPDSGENGHPRAAIPRLNLVTRLFGSGRRDRDASGVTTGGRTAASRFAAAAAQRHRDDIERRRRAHPDLAAAMALAGELSPELWQRRPGDVDVFEIPIGLADVDWSPPLNRGPQALASAQAVIAGLGPMPMVPVTVNLLSERGVGLVGGTEFSRSLARGLLVEAAVTHGPADLDVVVLSSPDRAHAWEWVKWLPHARVGGSARIYSTVDQVAGWAAAVRRGWERPSRPTTTSHVTLVVVDEPGWWRDRAAPLRSLLSDASMPLRFVALTAEPTDVPAVCTTVVSARPDGGATIDYLMERRRVDELHPFLASGQLALATARRLASLDDPDVPIVADSALPTTVSLLRLLGLEAPTASGVIGRWSRPDDGRVATAIGVTEHGPLSIDLLGDGPHGLIAGAKGSGKSELLRTVVVGLAATMGPEDINFVLIDGLDGGAFGACADLPHTVGVVSGVDEHIAQRVRRSMNAELQYRGDVLHAAGAASFLDDQRDPGSRLPRLVIVVDEFAAVAAEVPDFAPALVGIAERGGALGVHVLLATERPADAVDDRIRAESNLRVALQVHDDGDSLDVIGTKDAAHLPRRAPGRGYLRVGGGGITVFQAATTGGVTDDLVSVESPDGATVDVAPSVISRELTPMEQRLVRLAADEARRSAGTPSDLERLVAAIGAAADELGTPVPRRPWPEPLPAALDFASFFASHPGDAIPYGLVDLPDEQRQAPMWWAPGPEGSLVAYGAAGAGTSSLLLTLVLGIAERYAPDDVHIYCLDADADADTGVGTETDAGVGPLAPLRALAHVGAVVGTDEPDRIARVATLLADLLDHRQRLALERGGAAAVIATEPSVVLVIDGVGSLRRSLDERRELSRVWGDLERVMLDGSPLGICTVLTAEHDGVVPPSVVAQMATRLVLRLGDELDYAAFGLGQAELPTFVPGRAITQEGAEVQLVTPPTALAEAIERARSEPATERPVRRIDPLPASVAVDSVLAAARLTPSGIEVPVGVDTRTGEPAVCPVTFGETVFITGPPGAGRSSLLVATALAAAAVGPDVAVHGIASGDGPLTELDGVDVPARPSDVDAWVQRIAVTRGRRLVLVDDADRLHGPGFERLAGLRDDDLAIVVAGRSDALRTSGHWTKPLQRYRTGVLLQPAPADGDLVRVSLGARLPELARHRGVLVARGEQVPILAAVLGTASSPPSEPSEPSAEGAD